jgi:hypothetical protein
MEAAKHGILTLMNAMVDFIATFARFALLTKRPKAQPQTLRDEKFMNLAPHPFASAGRRVDKSELPRSIPPGGMTFSLLGLSLGWKIPFPPGEF